MPETKHHTIYQTTNLITGKIYIGRHTTSNINDNYLGSGKLLKKDIKLFGRDKFKREILFEFDNPNEMIQKEIELLSREFVKRDDTYNLTIATGGWLGELPGYDETRRKLSEVNKGLVTVIDKDGNTFKTTVDDPRYVSGELRHNLVGRLNVKDSDGKILSVKLDDPRYLSGELIPATVGAKWTEERHENFKQKITDYWENNNHTPEVLERLRTANIGKVNVQDSSGKRFRVSVDDERIKSGELIYQSNDPEIKALNSESGKNRRWVYNEALDKLKFVNKEEVDAYLLDGWTKDNPKFRRYKS